MNFLKSIFGGSAKRSGDGGLYFYIKPKACKEIVRVRIEPNNELSLSDNGGEYFVRKLARGNRCPFEAELMLRFDRNRNLIEKTVNNGAFVTEAEYTAWVENQQTEPS